VRWTSKTAWARPAWAATLLCAGCLGDTEGIAESAPAATTVKFDFFHKPQPDVPLPNDLATRADATSATGLRLNSSLIAPTKMEARTRELVDELDGWGVFQPIVIPFTGPLDIDSILAGHRDPDYDPDNDVVYLVDIDRDSPEFGKLQHLDVGNGNYPVALEGLDRYGPNDPRRDSLSLYFEEANEDKNDNGKLDRGEDTDGDGLLDLPNYLPGICERPGDSNCPTTLAERADALMTFYERQTNTLIVRPMVPLRERTTYAVIVTRRIKDADGDPVGSPFPWIHHLAQTPALEVLPEVLPKGLALEDIAFAYSFTTQSIGADWVAVREGLYGEGPQAHLGDDYPARMHSMHIARSGSPRNPYIAYGEQLQTALEFIGMTALMGGGDTQTNILKEANRYIDYHSLGTFESPQLFRRRDKNGNFLPFNDQSWPNDLDHAPVRTYRGTAEQCADKTLAPSYGCPITYWLSIPRREVSARGENKPAPLVIWTHAITSTKLEALAFAGFMAKQGFAVIAIDSPSHGIALPPAISSLVDTLGALAGAAAPTLKAALNDRAFDQTGDGVADVGADMFTAYSVHTRDMVRQGVLDLLQLVRIIRSFDGKRRWDFDMNGDGDATNDIAGDYDGDGYVDIGRDSTLHTAGISMGAMMATLLASVEPHIETAGPIAGGGGLTDIGVRSSHSNPPVTTYLRLMGPVIGGAIGMDGVLTLHQVVPNGSDEGPVDMAGMPIVLARVDGVEVGDTMLVRNLDNDQAGCGLVADDGNVRAAVESDRGDRLRVEFYRGAVLVTGSEECEIEDGEKAYATVDAFETDFDWQDGPHVAGEKLVALGDGLGYRRGHADLRRSGMLGQVVVDRADPAVMARFLRREPLRYPNLDEETGTDIVVVTNIGDMTVPTSSGVALARAAGLIDYLNVDDRYGVPPNQLLIDEFVSEAVSGFNRFTCDGALCDGLPFVTGVGVGIHLDVDNLGNGEDVYRDAVPRLDPPLRLWEHPPEGVGPGSAAVFLYSRPEGKHEPPFPGEHTDQAAMHCAAKMLSPDCAAYAAETFDTGSFLVNMLMRAAKTGEVAMDRCLADNDCEYIPPLPPTRVCTDDCR
jgi:hypothetical protein